METLKFNKKHLLSIIESVLLDNANVEKYEQSGFGADLHVTSKVELALIESAGLHYNLTYIRLGDSPTKFSVDDIQSIIFDTRNTPEEALDLLMQIPRIYRPIN